MAGTFLRNLALETLFPSYCHLCARSAEESLPLCPECLNQIRPIGPARCEICGKGFEGEVAERLCGDCIAHRPNFDSARAFAVFDDPLVQVIHRFKYNRGFYYLDWMAEGLAQTYQREFADEKFDLIMPVPLHWLRLLRRGYNQAFILAQPLSKKLKLPLAAGALARTRHTESQVGLSPAKRKDNLKKSFEVTNPKRVEKKSILLVDDVVTTGATVDEAAKTLKKAGADKVCVLAVART